MDMASKHVQIRLVGDVLVAKLVDVQALYEHAVILEIGDVLYSLLARPSVSRLVVNLAAVEYAATEMIAKLVSLNRRAEQADIGLTLCGLGPVLADSLRSLRIDTLFRICRTEADALGPPSPASFDETVEHPGIQG
jgi:anti-anti-sigma regulatory factor